jgi:hypothetical protein
MMKIIAIASVLLCVASAASAASNPQSMAAGFPFPVYVNGTGTSQSNAEGIYTNQTQYTPASTAKPQGLLTLGVGNG